MNEWTLQAGSEGKGVYSWGEEQLWQRIIYAEAKMKFEKCRRVAKSWKILAITIHRMRQRTTPSEALRYSTLYLCFIGLFSICNIDSKNQ
jgi:hypothetical protein